MTAAAGIRPSTPTAGENGRRNWQQEWPLAIVLLLVTVLYAWSPTALTLRGEEPRRGRIAWEMLHSGDWVMPTEQHQPRLTRPPMHYWLIAASGWLLGDVNELAVRLPSLVAVILTAGLLYWYCRYWISPWGASLAALAYATFGQTLQLAHLGESESAFALFLAGSLMVWHRAAAAGPPSAAAWSMSYLLLMAATYTKGPQAPVYFVATVGLWLLFTRQVGWLFSRAHLLACGVALLAIVAWHGPYVHRMGWSGLWVLYVSETSKHVATTSWLEFFTHFALFPVEVFAGCLMPWSLWLLAFAQRRFALEVVESRSAVRFSALAVAVAWPTVWLAPDGNSRYLMPLYPFLAVLVGVAADVMLRAHGPSLADRLWQRLRISYCGLACAVAVVTPVLMGWGPEVVREVLTQSLMGPVITVAALATAVLWWWLPAISQPTPLPRWATTLTIGACAGGLYLGPVTALLSHRATSAAMDVAAIRKELNVSGATNSLVSLGRNHHLFTFYWAQPMPMLSDAEAVAQIKAGDVFCLHHCRADQPFRELPFHWELLAVVNCDRNVRPVPYDVVAVGRRLPAVAESIADADERSPARPAPLPLALDMLSATTRR